MDESCAIWNEMSVVGPAGRAGHRCSLKRAGVASALDRSKFGRRLISYSPAEHYAAAMMTVRVTRPSARASKRPSVSLASAHVPSMAA
jgi:hypothetical protein